MYLITIENSIGEQMLIEELFLSREHARSRISGSDSRFCYYYIYKIEMVKNEFKTKMIDKIWNEG